MKEPYSYSHSSPSLNLALHKGIKTVKKGMNKPFLSHSHNQSTSWEWEHCCPTTHDPEWRLMAHRETVFGGGHAAGGQWPRRHWGTGGEGGGCVLGWWWVLFGTSAEAQVRCLSPHYLWGRCTTNSCWMHSFICTAHFHIWTTKYTTKTDSAYKIQLLDKIYF